MIMIKTTIRCLLIMLSTVVLMSCGANDDNVETDNETVLLMILKDAQTQFQEKKDMPQWLVDKIDWMENNRKSVPWASIYQGKWNEKTIYFIENPLNSCLFCNVYDEEGQGFDWTLYNFVDICKSASEWCCIYYISPIT